MEAYLPFLKVAGSFYLMALLSVELSMQCFKIRQIIRPILLVFPKYSHSKLVPVVALALEAHGT